MNQVQVYSNYGPYTGPPEEEEEIWDRECFLDPMWEIQQKKTFTAWINSHLRKAGTNIDNIEEDLRNGLKLMLLLETLSEEQLPKPDRGRMRFHKIANVNKALEYIENKGVQLVSIGAEEIVDGNIKMTLGMIWTIILRFCIQDITVEEMSAKEGLLLWCQRKTAPYKNTNVQNFHMSWKDGLAFCALIHRHRPELLDYSKLSRDNPMENLNMAFDVAEKHLDIPRMLDAEDMVNTVKPDERSVMTYVAAYYHAFAGAQKVTLRTNIHFLKAETAANRISKVLQVNKENEVMMQKYEGLASDLLKWIESKMPFLQNRVTDGTLAGTRAKLDKYRSYRGLEKPPKVEEKSELETIYNNLQTRLRLANKPAFMPTEGRMMSDIHAAWRQLENHEKGFEDWLLAEIRRLEQIEYLAKKFRLKCAIHEAWSKGKVEILADTSEYEAAGLSRIRACAHKHEAFESDLGSHQARVERIVSIAEELNALQYHDVTSVNERTQRIVTEWDRLGQISQKRKKDILSMLNVLEKIDQIHLLLAKRVSTFNSWLEQATEDLQDMFIVHRVEEIAKLIQGHEAFKRTLPAAEKELGEMLNEVGTVEQIVRDNKLPSQLAKNHYTMVDHETLMDRWNIMQKLIPGRETELQEELVKQQTNERMRAQFAQLANQVGPWIERSLDTIEAVISSRHVKLEDQFHQLTQLEQEIDKWRSSIIELEQCNQIVQDKEAIVNNPHTRYTMETIRVGWEQLLTNMKKCQSEVQNQILTRDARGVSEAQMEECRRCFNHFDRQRTRRLEPLDFRACLVSIGHNVPNNSQGEAEFRRIMTRVDPNNTGYVTFDAFMNFVTRQSKDADSIDHFIDSFKTLANDAPYITAETLRRELPKEEAEYCIKHMKPIVNGEQNALDYMSFSNHIYGVSDL